MNRSIVFSIAEKINPISDKPFGSQYEGDFKVRRPTIADTTEIQIRKAAAMNRHGVPVEAHQLSGPSNDFLYIFTYMSVVAENVPDWFDSVKMYEDDENDENAILAVWKEVRSFIDGFRPKPVDTGSS
jgi:hypothetical protein